MLVTWPDGIARSVLDGAMLVPPHFKDPGKQGVVKFYFEHYWATQTEDMVIAEACQRNLAGGGLTHFTTGRNEFLVQAFHDNIEAALDGQLDQWRD